MDMTPKQKDLLRWIVSEVNSDSLPEAGIRFKFPNAGSPTIENYDGDQTQIPVKSLSTQVISLFESNKYLTVRRMGFGSYEIHECTLKLDAYTAAEVESQHFFPQGSTHDAYITIKRITSKANKTLTIVDPYIDESIFPMLASIVKSTLTVNLLTAKVPSDFALEAKKFTTTVSGFVIGTPTT